MLDRAGCLDPDLTLQTGTLGMFLQRCLGGRDVVNFSSLLDEHLLSCCVNVKEVTCSVIDENDKSLYKRLCFFRDVVYGAQFSKRLCDIWVYIPLIPGCLLASDTECRHCITASKYT